MPPPDAPVLIITRHDYRDRDRLVEMAVLTNAGSRLSYEMTLRRRPP